MLFKQVRQEFGRPNVSRQFFTESVKQDSKLPYLQSILSQSSALG